MQIVLRTTKLGDASFAHIWKSGNITIEDWIETAMANDHLGDRFFVIGPIGLNDSKVAIREVVRKPT